MNEMSTSNVAAGQRLSASASEAEAMASMSALHLELELFKDVFVRHPDVEAAWDLLTDLLDSGALPSGAECAVISGPRRSGKTKLLKRFVDDVDARVGSKLTAGLEAIQFRAKPAVLVEVPSGASLKTLAEATLSVLGDPAPGSGSTASMMLRAYNLLRRRGVRVLIFEEFQHLIDRDNRARTRIANKAADFVKSILNQGICGVVLSGMPEVEDILAVNPQLEARCMGMIRMRGLGFETSEERKLFRFCLHKFEGCLPLPGAFPLTDMDIATRLHVASGGLVGIVAHILACAVRVARREGQDSLSLDLLARTFERLPLARNHKVNPFVEQTLPALDQNKRVRPRTKVGA